jgi:hypothetical protein
MTQSMEDQQEVWEYNMRKGYSSLIAHVGPAVLLEGGRVENKDSEERLEHNPSLPLHSNILSKFSIGTGPHIAIIAGTHPDEYAAYLAMQQSFDSLLADHKDLTQKNTFDFYIIHPEYCTEEERMRFETQSFKKDHPALVIDLHSQELFRGFFIDTIISHDWYDKKSKQQQMERMTKPILRYAERHGVRLAEFGGSPVPPLSVYDGGSVKKGQVIGFIHQDKALSKTHHLYGDTGYMASKMGIPALTFEAYLDSSKQLVAALDGLYTAL